MGLGRVEETPARGSSGRLTAWLVFVGVLAAIQWGGRLSSGQVPKDVAYRWDYALGSVLQFALMLLVIALIARGAWGLLALRRPRSWGSAVGTGILVLVGVAVLSVLLEPVLHPGREQGLAPNTWEPRHAAAFAVFAFAVVVLAPLTEELAFRGLGFGLLRPFGLVPPIVGSAFLWALAHGLVDALPVITFLGVGLAWIRYRQDSTIPGMILHGTFNAIALGASLLL